MSTRGIDPAVRKRLRRLFRRYARPELSKLIVPLALVVRWTFLEPEDTHTFERFFGTLRSHIREFRKGPPPIGENPFEDK